MTWSNPQALALWRSPLLERLLRFHSINYTLFFVLWSWVPTAHVREEEEQPLANGLRSHKRHEMRVSMVFRNRRDTVFRFLMKSPKTIPLLSSPSSAYFLLSQENFMEAWRDWLLCALQNVGYDVSPLYRDSVLNQNLFTEVSTALSERIQRGLDVITDSCLRVILDRSGRIYRLKAASAPEGGGVLGRADRSNATTACTHCKGEKQRCVQDLVVRVRTPDNNLAGCGVSAHPLEEVADLSIQNGGPAVKSLLHPERDLGLQLIECDEAVIYNAFSESSLKTLRGHVNRFSALKGIMRGQQFAIFSQGRMCPFGERTATGGAPGDAHRFYDSMGAQTEGALQCLFDRAESPGILTNIFQDSLILLNVTRLVAPGLYAEIRDSTREGEKLGLDAATLYYCSSYAGPLHIDDDVTPGVCALLEREAGSDDYCFVNLAYGYRFAPRANSLWSFRGTDLHGTSLAPLRLRGGKSITLHISKPKRNAKAAERYAKARRVRNSVYRYWTAETDGMPNSA
ncbi:hypothetical protein FA13DRAFT_1712396 [Coprinellus micaceus]|uniref:Uncharacterized protein n=1 Tax=Coprinellus micaceus TaxID=71717 RepID=A0A4Y7T103_COPMI|nr:hypothetical protein FA13DRAFT_1712396 [Coprinellus micaceus]